MDIVVANIFWIMIVSGALTLTMLFAFIAPQASLRSNFGEGLDGPVAEVVVRNWGALIAIIGAMLIYGAYDEPSRPLVLVVAAVSKIVFIGLVLSQGSRFLGKQVGVAVVVDAVMIALFAAYLYATRL